MKYNDFKKAVNEEFKRCARYEDNVKLSMSDCDAIAEYFTQYIYEFYCEKYDEIQGDIFICTPEYLGSSIYEATDGARSIDCEIYFDIGLKKAFVLQCWYEDDVEYIFGIKEY